MLRSATIKPIRIGVLSDEPLRLEGLTGIFEDLPARGLRSAVSGIRLNLDD